MCIVTWRDAIGDSQLTLEEIKKKRLAVNITIGRLKYYDKETIKLSATAYDTVGYANSFDVDVIPLDWVEKIEWIEE